MSEKEVIITDGLYAGRIGHIGGRKGKSIAVCFDDMSGGHDCDGMCPKSGHYEPDYAVSKVSEVDISTIKTLNQQDSIKN